MAQLKLGELVDVGVDWITVTTREKEGTLELGQLGKSIIYDEVQNGNFERPWSFRDYKGWHAGHAEYGFRSTEGILRLGGPTAADQWRNALDVSDKVTRVDIQATYKQDQGEIVTLTDLHDLVYSHVRTWTTPLTITKWHDNKGGMTVYLGARKSDLYFRAYAKGAESGLIELHDCVRFELELKNGPARKIMSELYDSSDHRETILQILGGYLAARGCSTKMPADVLRSFYERPIMAPDVVKRLEWLQSSVRPLVMNLVDSGFRDAVLDVLGLDKMVL